MVETIINLEIILSLLDSAFTAMVGENFSPPQELTAQLIVDRIVTLTWEAPEGHSGKNYQDSGTWPDCMVATIQDYHLLYQNTSWIVY